MGMRTVNDPYGDPSVLVDTVFGTSYDAVRDVANNIDYVKKVANLFDTSDTIVSNIHQRYVSVEGQNEFELPVSVVSEAFVTVFVNGKWKSPSVTYTSYGTTLFFNQALFQGDVVDVMIVSSETFDVLQNLKEDAEQSENRAQEWAEAPEDTEVETDQYSAKHHSAKASAQRVQAETARTESIAARNAAEAAQAEAEDAAASIAPYASRAAAEAATVPASVDRIGVFAPNWDSIWYKRDAAGTALTTGDGAKWSPDGVVTPEHWGAAGDGVTNDHTAFLNAMAAPEHLTASGTFRLAGLGAPSKKVSGRATLLRSTAGNMMTGNATGAHIEGWTFDMNRAEVSGDGQGMSMFGSNFRIRDAEVRGFSRMASGGGTGVLAYSPDLLNKTNRGWLENLTLIGHTTTTAAETFGWILADVDYSFVSHIYAENIFGIATAYGHELKNTSSYNNLHALTTKQGIYGYGHGQQFAGQPGPVGNVGWGIVNAQCDRGVLVADGKWNLIGGSVTDWDNSPQNISRMGVYGSENEEGGVFPLHLVHGAGEGTGVHLRNASRRNYVSVALHTPNSTKMVEFVQADTVGNMVNVLHTGARTSVIPYIVDTTGNGLKGVDANVVHSASTGERIGSRSGRFHDKLGSSGATPLSSAAWLFENDTSSRLTGLTPEGDQFGLDHAVPGRVSTGALYHSSNAVTSNEYWELRTGGVNVLRWFGTVMRAVTDVAYDLGSSAFRFRDAFAQRIRPGAGTAIWTSGAGTPEGSVTAPVGSLYTRTDGGAATVLYIKETGSGNTGWVAK